MIKLIRNILKQLLDDIDSGNSNISEKEQEQLLNLLSNLNRQELSKLEAADYIGVSRATFDNYIKNGWIPKGRKRMGFNELSWNKLDLDNFLKWKKT